jgi:hypothetical protein
LAHSVDAEFAAEHDQFRERAAGNTIAALALGTLLEYVQLKKKVRTLNEAAARDKLFEALNAGQHQKQFEYAQALRDFGWLYYYILRFHIFILKKRVSIPAEIPSMVESIHSRLIVLHKVMIKQQAGKGFAFRNLQVKHT